MNKLTIIGNLTRDPELRTTQSGVSVCSFTVAVNKRRANADGTRDADFFRVSAWRQMGENCAKWLVKGKKVAVIGDVTLRLFQGNDGKTYGNMEVTADEVEFLSQAGQIEEEAPKTDQQTGFTAVETDELPFE